MRPEAGLARIRLGRLQRWVTPAHAASLAGVAAETGLSLVASVLVARLLLPEGRGQLGRWVYWSGVATGLATVGMTTAIPQLVGAKRVSAAEARGSLTLLAAAFVPIGVLSGYLFTELACPDSGPRAGWYWMLAATVPGGVLGALAGGVLVAVGRIKLLMATRAATAGARALAVAALLALGLREATPASLAFSISIGTTGVILAAAARPALPTRATFGSIRPLLARGGAIHAPALAGIALTVVNQGWVYSRLSSADAGLWAVAAGSAATLQVLSLAELTASTVGMSDIEHGWAAVRTALGRVTGLSALGLLAGVLVSPVALPLVYGAAYSPAVLPFCLLLLATAAENVGKVGQGALQSRGYPKVAWAVDGVRATILVVAMLTFGTQHGVPGVAAATAASQVAGLVTSLVLLARAQGWSRTSRGTAPPEQSRDPTESGPL